MFVKAKIEAPVKGKINVYDAMLAAEIQRDPEDKDEAQPYPQTELGLREAQQERTRDEVQYAADFSERTHNDCA